MMTHAERQRLIEQLVRYIDVPSRSGREQYFLRLLETELPAAQAAARERADALAKRADKEMAMLQEMLKEVDENSDGVISY